MIRWHKADMLNRMYVHVDGNKKVSMPRYIKNRLYDEDEREDIHHHQLLLVQKSKADEQKLIEKNPKYLAQKMAVINASFHRQLLKSKKQETL